MSSCPTEFLQFSHRLADAVADIHRRHFRSEVTVEIKADGTPVTEVDRAAEEAVREQIMQAYPEHGVIGEEYPAHRPDAEYVWVVDPLDGTKLYLSGKPDFGLMLALAHHGRFILGVIDHAALGERWVGADGHGTVWNGRAVRTRPCPGPEQAVVCRPGPNSHTRGKDALIDRITGAARWTHWGLPPHDYGLLAAGFIDLIVTAGPQVHDLAPLDPVIRNAGGAVCDWSGRALDIHSGPLVVAAGDPALLGRIRPWLEAPAAAG